MTLLRAEAPAGEAAVDLAVFAAAASAVGWPADNSNSSAGTNQFIGFIVIFKFKLKTAARFCAIWAPVKYPKASRRIRDVWARAPGLITLHYFDCFQPH
jgi:hypothetical protein